MNGSKLVSVGARVAVVLLVLGPLVASCGDDEDAQPLYERVLRPAYRNAGEPPTTLPPGQATPNAGGGVAFDGQETLYFSVDDGTAIINRIDVDGTDEQPVVPLGLHIAFFSSFPEDSVLSLAYDQGRTGLWVGPRGSTAGQQDPCREPTGGIYFLDLSNPDQLVLEYKWSLADVAGYDETKTPSGNRCDIGSLDWDGLSDTLWISEMGSERVYQVDPDGVFVSSFDVPGEQVRGIATDGSSLWIGLLGQTDEIRQYTAGGTATGATIDLQETLQLPESASVSPFGIAFDSLTFGGTCVLWNNPAGTNVSNGTERFRTQLVAVEVACDLDADGIEDPIDTNPASASDEFDDGTTAGSITNRGDQTVTVSDDPADGVIVSAGPGGGQTPATVSLCDGTVALTLNAGDSVAISCDP